MDSAQTLLREVVVEPLAPCDEGRYCELLDRHHYLKSLPKIGQTIWYVAHWRGEWVALDRIAATIPFRVEFDTDLPGQGVTQIATISTTVTTHALRSVAHCRHAGSRPGLSPAGPRARVQTLAL